MVLTYTSTRTLFRRFQVPRPHRQAPWSPRTAHRPVPTRTDALLSGPIAPYGYPEQPPPKEYPIPKQTRCLRSLPGSRTGHTDAATQTHRSGTGEAMGIGGAAAEKVGTALPITVVTAASMNGATAENRERKQVSAFMFACRWLYEPRCAHVGGRARAHLRSRRRSCRAR